VFLNEPLKWGRTLASAERADLADLADLKPEVRDELDLSVRR